MKSFFPQLWYTYEHFYSPNLRFDSHFHNTYEVIFFLNVDGNYCVDGQKFPLNKYDLIISRPAVLHAIYFNSNQDYERIMIRVAVDSRFAEYLKKLDPNIHIIDCSDSTIIKGCFERFLTYFQKLGNCQQLNELAQCLFTEVFYNLQFCPKTNIVKPHSISPIIQKSINYIDSHLETIEDIEEISNHLYIAKNYFFRIFKEQMNISPKKYITIKRLLKAQMMIAEGELPTRVYSACGFSNYVSFYKSYLAYFGYAPSQESKPQ